MTIATTGSTPTGTFSVIVSASASGYATKSSTITFNVNPPTGGPFQISPASPGSTALNTPSPYTFKFRPPAATNWVNWGTVVFEDPALFANGTGTPQNTCSITVNAVEAQIFDSTGASQNLYPGQLHKSLAQRTNNYCWFLDESHLTISVDSATNTLTATVWFAFNPTQAYFQTQHVLHGDELGDDAELRRLSLDRSCGPGSLSGGGHRRGPV